MNKEDLSELADDAAVSDRLRQAVRYYLGEYDAYQLMFTMYRMRGWSGSEATAPDDLVEQIEKTSSALSEMYRVACGRDKPDYVEWCERIIAEAQNKPEVILPH